MNCDTRIVGHLVPGKIYKYLRIREKRNYKFWFIDNNQDDRVKTSCTRDRPIKREVQPNLDQKWVNIGYTKIEESQMIRPMLLKQ